MKRFVALLVLLAVALSIVAPVALPCVAFAATGTATSGLPGIPWAQVWTWIKTWGPMIIYLIDSIISTFGGGGTPSGSPPPPPPGDPSVLTPVGCRAPDLSWNTAWPAGVVPA